MNDESKGETRHEITIVGALSSGASRTKRRDIVEKAIDVAQVQENFGRFLEGLKAIVDVEVPAVGGFELDEVQFSAEISANGEFKLMGTGVGIAATSGVTFTLRRITHSPGG